MSYPVFDFGVILTEEQAIDFAVRFFEVGDDERASMSKNDLYDLVSDCEAIAKIYNTDNVTIEYVNGVDDVIGVWMGYDAYRSTDDIVYILELNLPRMFTPVYNSVVDAVNDAYDRYGEYLPEDFNIKDRLAVCIGSCYE